MSSFDINQYVETDDWQPYIKTAVGYRVRIFTVTRQNEFCIIGEIDVEGQLRNQLMTWRKDGTYGYAGGTVLDLVSVPVEEHQPELEIERRVIAV